MEQLDDNLLFRGIVGLNPDNAIWVPSAFSKNRDRLIDGHMTDAFLQDLLRAADARALLSREHITEDGTLLEAWPSHKSVLPKNAPPPPSDGDPKNPTIHVRGEKRSNATHQSLPTPTRGSREGARGRRVSSGTWGVCSWTIGMG